MEGRKSKKLVLFFEKKQRICRVPIRQLFEKTTKSASAKQDWTTKQAALSFG